ncbi:hypothetical protein AGIG_G7588 [Arapaima gigas]
MPLPDHACRSWRLLLEEGGHVSTVTELHQPDRKIVSPPSGHLRKWASQGSSCHCVCTAPRDQRAEGTGAWRQPVEKLLQRTWKNRSCYVLIRHVHDATVYSAPSQPVTELSSVGVVN